MNINSTNFEQICRTCLTKAVNMRNITECILKDITLAQMITYCTSITTNEDSFPNNICSDCEYQVSIAYKFKLKTAQVDMTLRQYLEEQSKEKAVDDNILDVEGLQDANEIYDKYVVQECTDDEQVNTLTVGEDTVYEDTKIEELCDYDNNCIEFNSKEEIVGENNSEEKKRLHVCTVCSKSYVQQAGLVWHMRIHTGERPFLCSHCANMKASFVIISIMIAFVSFVDCKCGMTENKRYYSTDYYYIAYTTCTRANIMDVFDLNWSYNGNLQVVSFYKSHIPKLSNDIISVFGKLYIFTINGSFVNTIEAEAFYLSNDLIELNLPYNNLTILSTDTFRYTQSLIILDLSHNNIQNISKDLFRNNYALEHLNLSNNALTSLEIDNFNELTNLLYLNLSGNTISEVPNAHFGYQSKLITLDLSRNRIKSLDIHSFIGLTSLSSLDLRGNIIQSLQENVFYNVHQLSILDISENLIGYINAKELTETTKLSQISLHSNKMRCTVLLGIIKIFKSLNVIVTYGPERKQMSILGIRCNDTRDIVTENNNETMNSMGTKTLDSLDEFFAKGFKNSDFYKFFNTFNSTGHTVDTYYVKQIVADIMGMNYTHGDEDYTQHMELMGQLSSLQMWFGSLIVILLIIIASAWIYIYFNRNVNGGKRKDSQLMDESIV